MTNIDSTLVMGNAQQGLEALSRSVPVEQMFREFLINGVQACGKARGTVVWDYCDETVPGVRKLRIYDTGIGLAADDMLPRLGTLFADARSNDNFGVGAKLSAVRTSPYGVQYYSLHDGVVSSIRFGKDHSGAFGILPSRDADGTLGHVSILSKSDAARVLPKAILKAGHGTAVVFLGQNEHDPTLTSLNATAVGEGSCRWLVSYLEQRFANLPENVTISCLDEGSDPNRQRMRAVRGSEHHLNTYSAKRAPGSGAWAGNGARGSFRVSAQGLTATAHWWLLDSDAQPASPVRVAGAVRVIHNGEAYYTSTDDLRGPAGVWLGNSRVAIHFVPDPQHRIVPDATRTRLTTANGTDLPVREWCQQFARKMPVSIQNMIKEQSAAGRAGRSASWAKWNNRFRQADRLLQSERMFEIPDFVKRATQSKLLGNSVNIADLPGDDYATDGAAATTSTATVTDPTPPSQPATKGGKASGSGSKTKSPNCESNPKTKSSANAAKSKLPLPLIIWDVKPDEDLRDYPARYDANAHRLIINSNYPVHDNLLTHARSKVEKYPGGPDRADQLVRERIELHYAEIILGTIIVLGGKEDMIATTLTPQAFTVGAVTVATTALNDVEESLRGNFRNLGR